MVLSIASFESGEAFLNSDLTSINILVLDVGLPGMDGFAVCKEVRKASSLPIIMLTAASDDVDRILGLELGADDYMGKPFNPRELLARGLRYRCGEDAAGRRSNNWSSAMPSVAAIGKGN